MKKFIAFCLVTVLLCCTACNNRTSEDLSSAALLSNGERFYDVCSFVKEGNEQAQEFVVKELSYVTNTAKIVAPLEVNMVVVEDEDNTTILRALMPDGMNLLVVNEEGTAQVPVVYMNSEDTGDAWIAEVKVDIEESVSLWVYKPSGGNMDAEIEIHPVLV